MPNSTTSCTASGKAPASTVCSDVPAWRRATRMRFSVSVPVLSVHSTVAEPSASTAGNLRASTRLFEMRQAPMAMKTVSTTGNSSGSTAIASAMPASSPCNQPSPRSP